MACQEASWQEGNTSRLVGVALKLLWHAVVTILLTFTVYDLSAHLAKLAGGIEIAGVSAVSVAPYISVDLKKTTHTHDLDIYWLS